MAKCGNHNATLSAKSKYTANATVALFGHFLAWLNHMEQQKTSVRCPSSWPFGSWTQGATDYSQILRKKWRRWSFVRAEIVPPLKRIVSSKRITYERVLELFSEIYVFSLPVNGLPSKLSSWISSLERPELDTLLFRIQAPAPMRSAEVDNKSSVIIYHPSSASAKPEKSDWIIFSF